MRSRYLTIIIFFIFSFSCIVTKLFYWQIVKAQELNDLGDSQSIRHYHMQSQRGEIQTSDGFPIVTNKISYLLYANPKVIGNKEEMAQTLSSLTSVDTATISGLLSLDRFWVRIKQNVSVSDKKKIEIKKLPGIGFEEQYSRLYPEASLGAHIIGFVAKDEGGNDKGYFGLEGYYDRQLQGKGGEIVEVQDAFGRPILAKLPNSVDNEDGRSLQLHIDRAIQFIAETELKKGVEAYGASGGLVAIMDPKTGGMLAMSSFPSFDPTTYQDFDNNLYKDAIISSMYEPGSTFKSLIMASGIDAKVVKPETKCPICSQALTIDGYPIKTWNDKYVPNIDMIHVIQNSDNTGMVYVSRSLGHERMLKYLKSFGIGDLTGIDLQGEYALPLRPIQDWHTIDFATTSFGQGISVTPIMLLDAFAAIANEGKRMEPHVASAIKTPQGDIITIPPKQVSTPISPQTAKVMTEILVNAVEKGEAKWARLKGYRIAGKTGTAQIPIAGKYDLTKTIASFIGFAPANDPKFVMLVVVDRPTTSIYGAETAAPIFFNIAKSILTYYNISATQEE